jgi:hypothetical protein
VRYRCVCCKIEAKIKDNRAYVTCDCSWGGEGPTLIENEHGVQIDHERFHVDAPDTDPPDTPGVRKTAWEHMDDL